MSKTPQTQSHLFQGNPIRFLEGPTPKFVTQDVALALGLPWQGAARLAQRLHLPLRSLSFAQAAPWVARADGRATSRMSVVSMSGLTQALGRGTTKFFKTDTVVAFKQWLTVGMMPTMAEVVEMIKARTTTPPPTPEPPVHQINTVSDELVTLRGYNGAPCTTSLAIAVGVGNDHASVIKLIRRYRSHLEKSGLIRFEIQPKPQGQRGGGDTEYALLDEQQATTLMSLMSNSDPVVEFKVRLVDAFFRMKHQLQAQSTRVNTRPSAAPVSFSALALHQAKVNDLLNKGHELVVKELAELRASHEDLEARVANLALMLEGDGSGA